MVAPKEIELMLFLAHLSSGLLTGAALLIGGYFTARFLHGN
jgi:hypothetical protein